MKKEEALQLAISNPELLCVFGSRLYGTSRPTSDYDYRGFVIPPYEYLLGISSFKDAEVPGADHKVYSMKRFLELSLSGDPQCSELFFTPESLIINKTEYGQAILELKPYIISNKIYNRIMGYGYSEWRKAQGMKLEIADRGKDEDDIVAWVRDHKKWDKDRMDEFCEWMDEDKEKKLVPSTRTLGEKRKKEFEQFGFGVSSAAHSLRLTQELAELLSTGNVSFPRPNAELLLAIRQGKYSLSEVEKMYEESRELAEKARNNSVLQNSPNVKMVWDVYSQIVSKFISKDDRFSACMC